MKKIIVAVCLTMASLVFAEPRASLWMTIEADAFDAPDFASDKGKIETYFKTYLNAPAFRLDGVCRWAKNSKTYVITAMDFETQAKSKPAADFRQWAQDNLEHKPGVVDFVKFDAGVTEAKATGWNPIEGAIP